MGTSAQKMYPTPLVKFVMVMLKTNLVSSREIARESLQISGGHDNSLPSLPPFFSVSGSSICLWLSCVKALPFYLPSSLTGLLSRFLVECWKASSPLQATPGIWGINLGEMLLHLTSFHCIICNFKLKLFISWLKLFISWLFFAKNNDENASLECTLYKDAWSSAWSLCMW